MNRITIDVPSTTSEMMLDEQHHIIAAGPVVIIDNGVLLPSYIRAVLRFSEDFDSGPYVTSIEYLSIEGAHIGFDPAADKFDTTTTSAIRRFTVAVTQATKQGDVYQS